jgi:hypothetical protein
MRWTRQHQALLRKTNGPDADGEIVCGPGIPTLRPSSQKVALASGPASDVGKKARSPDRSPERAT